MKSHIPATKRLSHSARQAVSEYNDELQAETFRRWLKLTTVILHGEPFNFGHDRCAEFLGKISKLAETEKKDEIFWLHIDKVVNEELNLDFKPENYAEVER